MNINPVKALSNLPEGEEDDGLYGEELEDGTVGSQQVLGSKVEHHQGVQGQ
jgi:hypothetical protein